MTIKYVLCANVGPVHLSDFVRNKWRPRLETGTTTVGKPVAAGGPPAGEAERVLRQVEWKFTSLTRTVPMVEIEDLPPSMQPHVVGAPRTWVHLFWHLEKFVDHYNRANMPHP
jgi:hypothetical protein